jgi:uncharacterized protein
LSLIRKRATAAAEAAKQFGEQDRADLKEKEEAQVAILEEYAGQIKTLSVEEMEAIVTETINTLKESSTKLAEGHVLKALFSKGGPFDGKPVNRGDVAQLVKKVLSASN